MTKRRHRPASPLAAALALALVAAACSGRVARPTSRPTAAPPLPPPRRATPPRGALICAEPRATADEVCACLKRPPPARQARCSVVRRGDDPRLAVARLQLPMGHVDTGEIDYYLLARQPRGWAVVAYLQHTYNPGLGHIHQQLKIPPLAPRTVGGRRLLRLVTTLTTSDDDPGVAERSESARRDLTICLVPAQAAAPVRCPIQLPLLVRYVHTKLRERGDRLEPAHVRRISAQLSATLAPDGMLTVKVAATAGKLDELDQLRALAGRYQLWRAATRRR